jgi:hypothetical protein
MSRLLNIVVAVVIVLWAGFFTWTEIFEADPDDYSIKSPAVKQQLESCSGNFQQRQACAERITDARQQLGFLVWCEKVVIILGPPLVLWGLVNLATRQRATRRPPAQAPRRTAAAAQRSGPVRRRPGLEEPPPLRDKSHQPEPLPDKPADAPVFSGGRRQPVRRRDH